MIVGILALVFYNDPQVKDYFNRLNGMPVPVPPAPPAAPEPAQPVETETLPEAAPEAPSAPEPKKPRKRKVADESMDTAPEDNNDPAA